MTDGRSFNRRYDFFDYFATTLFQAPSPANITSIEKEKAKEVFAEIIKDTIRTKKFKSKRELIKYLKHVVLRRVYSEYQSAPKSDLVFYRILKELEIDKNLTDQP